MLLFLAGPPPEHVGGFSLHSCKATTLSWALQLGLGLELRAAQGHHSLAEQVEYRNTAETTYGPNCVAKRKLCIPKTPLHRGLEAVEEDKHLLAQLAFADVTESAPSENERIRHLRTKEEAGPWLLNLRTRSSHRAVPLRGAARMTLMRAMHGVWAADPRAARIVV